MKKKPYRSPTFISGSSDTDLHGHVDAPAVKNAEEKVLRMVQFQERLGNPGAIDYVYKSIAGPQRVQFPEVYKEHTPPSDALDFFSTTILKDRKAVIEFINYLGAVLSCTHGAIFEIEQPLGLLTANEGWKLFLADSDYITPIQQNEVSVSSRPTIRFETHHWFSIPKDGPPALSLEKLNAYLEKEKIPTGGLFILEGEDFWGYASNSFSHSVLFKPRIEREHALYQKFLQQEGIIANLESLVEQILFIGKS
jgi:hypothetical protein